MLLLLLLPFLLLLAVPFASGQELVLVDFLVDCILPSLQQLLLLLLDAGESSEGCTPPNPRRLHSLVTGRAGQGLGRGSCTKMWPSCKKGLLRFALEKAIGDL